MSFQSNLTSIPVSKEQVDKIEDFCDWLEESFEHKVYKVWLNRNNEVPEGMPEKLFSLVFKFDQEEMKDE